MEGVEMVIMSYLRITVDDFDSETYDVVVIIATDEHLTTFGTETGHGRR